MVYVLLGNGFEEIEAVGTVDILRRADIETKTVGLSSTVVRSTHGITFSADIEISEMTDDFDMIVLPGGMPGTLVLEKNPLVQKAIDTAVEKNAYIAAICAAPSILGHKGLLVGKEAVCYHGFENELKGAVIKKNAVCVSGKIITANGPGAVFAFAEKILEALGKNPAKVMGSMALKPGLY